MAAALIETRSAFKIDDEGPRRSGSVSGAPNPIPAGGRGKPSESNAPPAKSNYPSIEVVVAPATLAETPTTTMTPEEAEDVKAVMNYFGDIMPRLLEEDKATADLTDDLLDAIFGDD